MTTVSRARCIAALVLISLIGAGHRPSACLPERSTAKPLKVLFIGNSRIYYHNQPAMLEALAAANRREVDTEMLATAGATLSEHWSSGEARRLIESRPWDYVVINEQSTWGRTFLVAGVARLPMAPEAFADLVTRYAQACAANGARLVLIMQPPRREAPASDLSNLVASFSSVQRRTGAFVAPVGLAIHRAEAEGLDVYDRDGNHPSPVGAFVAASTIYATLFGEAPSRSPGQVRGAAVDEADGTVHSDTVVTLVDLPEGLDAVVAGIASRAVADWPSEAGAAASKLPSFHEELPRVPDPDTEVTDLAVLGSWRGTLDLYPRWIEEWPARMRLMIQEENHELIGRLELRFGGRPDDIKYSSIPISNEGAYFQFLDPDGPNGGYVRYRVVPSNGELRGIAEFITDRDVYGIGELRLRREP